MADKLILLPLSMESIKEYANYKGITIEKEVNSIEEIIGSKDNLLSLGLNFAIIYNYDSVHFGKLNDLDIELENMMEAKFFNREAELSFYRVDNDLKGNIVIDQGEDKLVKIEIYNVYQNKNYKELNLNNYNKFEVKKYIRFDEDRQGHFYYTKPCRFWRGE